MKNDIVDNCKICLKSFKINGSGVSQVQSHKSDAVDQFSLQRVFVVAIM